VTFLAWPAAPAGRGRPEAVERGAGRQPGLGTSVTACGTDVPGQRPAKLPFLPCHRARCLPPGIQRGDLAAAQVLDYRSQYVQPGGAAVPGPLLQPEQDLGGELRGQPQQADLPAHRNRGRGRPPAFLI